MKKNFESSSDCDAKNKSNPELEQTNIDQSTNRTMPQDIVIMLIGRWAMPTTVVLVLVTCLAGYFLELQAFTAVVGMISPVVMALIMVIKEALIGGRNKRNRKK
ncbi:MULTISPECIES: hypothetical protein [Pseudoalteromonas]|uniref:hypothetical protein n=1 Tax=Pseudoalteromonas TaxID=53246 RepID=UPI000BBF1FAB|nr:hypothetical protein [Pseudoalteromonas sp. 1_2015MBL_MicDiv]ATG76448.1 hypothetical protein AOR04_02215 [Pseudoalteromonas sp. 1_2015MBL_MicDiv]